MIRTTLALLLAAVVGLTAGCGSDDGAAPAAQATHTAADGATYVDADLAFANAMIPHHAQALEMTDLARGRTLDPEVETLVEAIQAVQPVEIEQMVDWLTAWGEPIPATSRDHVNAEDHGDMAGMEGTEGMPGMMTAEDMDALAASADDAFQTMFLEMMIAHHGGAVEMAVTEQADGQFAGAVEMAAAIETSQKGEIALMQELLDRLG